jgi:colanic acid/amylovoran biosynthesis protein
VRESAAVVEILGPWLKNKGDVLNLWAVAQRMKGHKKLAVSSSLGLDRLPDDPPLFRVVTEPGPGELREAARAGAVRTVLRLVRNGLVARLVPERILEERGHVLASWICLLLDCSGYAYGDVWSTPRTRRREAYYEKLRRAGSRIVMLPQALGPFQEKAMKQASRALFRHVDLVYARDPTSYEHARSLGVDEGKLALSPDISHLVKGVPPPQPEMWLKRVCIVPNARMSDKTDLRTSRAYGNFLLRCAGRVRERGLEPCLLLHESNDRPLAEEVQGAFDNPLPIIDEDALTSKGILGACHAAVSSRYHGLVSALSQGTLVMGTSWSHKYEELFRAYGCERYLVSPLAEAETVDARLSELLDPQSRSVLREGLKERALDQKAKVRAMWERIEALEEGKPHGA